MALNRDDILKADTKVSLISVPEWGGEVYVKRQSIAERDILIPISRGFMNVEQPKKAGEAPKITMIKGEEAEKAYSKYRLLTVGFALCDENGDRLFNDAEVETILSKKSPQALERIYQELGKILNGDQIES